MSDEHHDDEYRRIDVCVGPKGRIVIPASLRREMGLETGTLLTARIEDGMLILESPENGHRRIQERFSALVPDGVSLVDELIAERRAEALREEKEEERRSEARWREG